MHKWKMPGTEKLQSYKEGDGIKDEEYAGYYCLVLAIVCGLNAAEAWKCNTYHFMDISEITYGELVKTG